jgi:hypothetical protein
MNWNMLLNCFYKLKAKIFAKKRPTISLQIESNEILVRGILHPLLYSNSKKRLKESVFLPPPNNQSNTVSMNRLRYTDAHFCKQHAKSIRSSNSSYCGLATIIVLDISTVSDNSEDLKATVLATPIDENGEYVNTQTQKVFVDAKGTPMHADLTYTFISTPIEPYNPQTKLRKMANELLKYTRYFEDPFPDEVLWTGEVLN